MGVVYACAFSFMSKYLYQSCGPKPMTRVDINDNNKSSNMVVQDKKTGEIRVCVDIRKLNDSCLHDPFPTPFTDEVLDNVGGQEV
jgi:hypothetical protein